MLQKKIVREVNALVIRCPQKELGCEWEGELGQLQRHLNPGAGATSTQGCEFLAVECAYRCGAQLQRRLIQEHEMEACPKRPIEMQVASLMKKFEAVVNENQMLKQELDETKKMHLQSLDEIKQNVDEAKKMHQQRLDKVTKELGDIKQAHHQQREELRKAKEANTNLQRVCDVLKAEQKQIKAKVDDVQKFNRKIATLEEKYTSLQAATMPLPVPPFYVLLTNFDHYRVNNHLFKSDPFYSHVGGYKMTMIIRPNGSSAMQGTHVSLHVFLLPGEFDDQLRWPFNGRITVQAYNCNTARWSFKQVIEMNERNWGTDAVSRCGDELIRGGAGFDDFLSLTHLDKFISGGNCLRIRITRIEI
jgi:TNF receptor-associated factor 4